MFDPFTLNLRHLEALAVAVRLGSISAAAKARNMSQPAITQAIGRLEAQLDHVLIDRQPGGVAPTPGGRRLIVRIDRALSYLLRGTQSVRRGAHLVPLAQIQRRITLGQLRALMAVDDAGSFALASAQTGLSQPALHRSTRDIEEQLGVALLVRQGRTVRPTAAATRLLRFARLARAELDAGIDELRALRAQGGRLRIGTMPVARAAILPRALARFASMQPDAAINVVEGTYGDLLSRLREGELDLLLGALRDPAPVADVMQEPLFTDHPAIVGRSGHPLAKRSFAFEELARYPWVISPTGTPGRARWEQMFRAQGHEPPRLQIECGSVLVIRGLLLEGDWLTLLSPHQFHFEERLGLLAAIGASGAVLQRKIGITTRSDWHPTSLQEQFLDVLRTLCREELRELAPSGGGVM